MFGAKTRRPSAAQVLATGAVCLCMGCPRGDGPGLVHIGGSPSAPAVGVRLGDPEQVYVQRLVAGAEATEGAQVLATGEEAFFARDGSATALATLERRGAKTFTQVTLPSQRSVELAGEHWLQPIDGASVLAVAVEPEPDGRFRVQRLSATGEVSLELRTPEPEWVAGTPDGAFTAVGTLDGTLIHGRDGTLLGEVEGATTLGALSAAWIAVERERVDGRELVLRALSGPDTGEHVLRVQRGRTLRFDRLGRWLAHVSPQEVLLVALGSPPREATRLAPSGARRWRDVAFDGRKRVALSWIEIEQPLASVEGGVGLARVRGSARVGVELRRPGEGLAAPPLAACEGHVELWSATSPELGFDGAGRLFAHVWPLVFEVRP